jgi:hypothetical protein
LNADDISITNIAKQIRSSIVIKNASIAFTATTSESPDGESLWELATEGIEILSHMKVACAFQPDEAEQALPLEATCLLDGWIPNTLFVTAQKALSAYIESSLGMVIARNLQRKGTNVIPIIPRSVSLTSNDVQFLTFADSVLVLCKPHFEEMLTFLNPRIFLLQDTWDVTRANKIERMPGASLPQRPKSLLIVAPVGEQLETWILLEVLPLLEMDLGSIAISIIGVDKPLSQRIQHLGRRTMIPWSYVSADVCYIPQRNSELTNELAMAMELNIPLVTNKAGKQAIRAFSSAQNVLVRRVHIAETALQLTQVLTEPQKGEMVHTSVLSSEAWPLGDMYTIFGEIDRKISKPTKPTEMNDMAPSCRIRTSSPCHIGTYHASHIKVLCNYALKHSSDLRQTMKKYALRDVPETLIFLSLLPLLVKTNTI